MGIYRKQIKSSNVSSKFRETEVGMSFVKKHESLEIRTYDQKYQFTLKLLTHFSPMFPFNTPKKASEN